MSDCSNSKIQKYMRIQYTYGKNEHEIKYKYQNRVRTEAINIQ